MAIFDGNLKQRLIGALVLIVLAVVFLPMIFNNKGEKLPETVVTVPVEPAQPTQPVSQPIPDAITPPTEPTPSVTQTEQPTIPIVHNTNSDGVAATTTPSTPPATVQQATNEQVITTNNTPTTTKPVVSKPDAQGLTATWSVQVAAVSNLQNAEAFTNKLRKANYNAYTRTEGNLHRVFVGPFIEKAEAARVQKLIEKQFKEKGIIREFKPERQ